MKWEGHGQSDNIEDRRGMGSKGPIAVGGGVVGLIVVVLGLVFGVDLGGGGGAGVRDPNAPPADPEAKEFSGSVLKFTEEVWTEEFRKNGQTYAKPHMVLFDQSVDTQGCGSAPSAVGPFYCPADKTVYLDPTFFDELEAKLGGSKAKFSQSYVIAHEVGHHVQNLLGYNAKLKRFERFEGKNAGIRLELQADYLAGVWAYHAQKKYNFIEAGDVEAALTTARAIGDDRIQKKSQRWVSPESFTHGTAEQRFKYFREGMRTGDASKQALDRFFDERVKALNL